MDLTLFFTTDWVTKGWPVPEDSGGCCDSDLLPVGGYGSVELSASSAFRLHQLFCFCHCPGLSFCLPSLDFLKSWVLTSVLCKECEYNVVSWGSTQVLIPTHLYAGLIAESCCVVSQYVVSSTSSAVRSFLCVLGMVEGKVSANEAGDSLR